MYRYSQALYPTYRGYDGRPAINQTLSMLGETEEEKQRRLYNEGVLNPVDVTPYNAGTNAASGYKPEVLALMANPITVWNIVGGAAAAFGFYLGIAGTVNLFRKKYAGHRLRYGGGYLVLGGVLSGVGLMLNRDRINRLGA
jgi:hypothetical protein